MAGGLVRFEDETHKGKVLGFVEDVVREKKEKARKWHEVRGLEFEEDKEFGLSAQQWLGIGEKEGDKKGLVDDVVRGVYPELPTGQRPLIASVQRQLRNNESYGLKDSDKLVGRISTLIGTLQGQAAQQKDASAKQ